MDAKEDNSCNSRMATEVVSQTTPKGRAPLPLIKPKALSNFLRLAIGDGVDAAGLIDGRAGRLLGWEGSDEDPKSHLGWLISSLATEGVSSIKGNLIATMSILQGRLSLILVSYGSTASVALMTLRLEEMKRAIDGCNAQVLSGISHQAAKEEEKHDA